MKIKHVKQGPMECGPAVLAMATAVSLKKAKSVLKKSGWIFKSGVTRKDILTALEILNHDCAYSDGQFIKKHYKKAKGPCLFLVPSKNTKNGYHYVLIYKKKIYDPQEGVKGMKTYSDDDPKNIVKKSLFMMEIKKAKKP